MNGLVCECHGNVHSPACCTAKYSLASIAWLVRGVPIREILSVVYLRAICAVFIVLFHAAGRDDITGTGQSPLEQAFALGASRVDIFFVISGFVLFIATAKRGGEPPGGFLLRRIMRIAPLYWVFTLALASMALGWPKLFPNLKPTAQDIALSLFFILHFSASRPDKIWPILVQGWALTYEVIFYLMFTIALFARLFVILKLADRSTAMGLVFIAACGIAATGAGILSWRWLEKPLAEWFRTALAPRPTAMRGSAAAD